MDTDKVNFWASSSALSSEKHPNLNKVGQNLFLKTLRKEDSIPFLGNPFQLWKCFISQIITL